MRQVVVTTEQRFVRTPDGAIYTPDQFGYAFWQRYLEVFDAVKVIGRVQDVPARQEKWHPVEGIGVTVSAVSYYLGPIQYLTRVRAAAQAARAAVGRHDAVILRVPSPIADLIAPILRKDQRPHGLEVVADPYDVFAPGANHHPLRAFFRQWFTTRLQRQCRRASAVAYVTQQTLQRRYPLAPNVFSTNYSSVELGAKAFGSAHTYPSDKTFFNLVLVGTFSQPYKAQDVVVDAVKQCINQGLDLHLALVGEGQFRRTVEQQVADLGLQERVRFIGQLPSGEAVRAQLDAADLFVLPSRTDGLPRAMIEAMARGLPCIGSTVGGIPELLPAKDLVPPADSAALAAKLREVLTNPARLRLMSTRNLEAAADYHEDVLRQRRIAFYEVIKEQTERWNAYRPA